MKLNIELVPSTSWGTNLRSLLSKKDWDFLRKRQYKLAGGVCEVCGGKGKDQGRKHDLECHEQWQYDDVKYTQTLVGLIALCPNCHGVVHFGHSQLMGHSSETFAWFLKINNMTILESTQVFQDVRQLWLDRSSHSWVVDVSWLDQFNIKLKDHLK